MSQLIKTSTWNGMPIAGEVVSLVGEVVKISRSTTTTTNVTGGGGSVRTTGGGGGYTHPAYSGFNKPKTHVKFDPVKVNTKTTIHDDVYLIDSTGKEHFIQFTDRPELGIREGHQLQLLSINANVAGTNLEAPFVAILNKSLGKVFYDHSAFRPIQFYQASQFKLAKSFFIGLPTIKKVLFLAYLCLVIMCLVVPPVGAIMALPLIFIVSKSAKSLVQKQEQVFNTEVVPVLKATLT